MNQKLRWLLALSSFAFTTSASAELPTGLNGRKATYAEHLVELRNAEHQEVVPTDRESFLSLQELHRGYVDSLAAVKGLYVDFVYDRERLLETAFDLNAREDGRLPDARERLRIRFAMSGSKRFAEHFHLADEKRFQDTPPQRTRVFDGEVYKEYSDVRRMGKIDPNYRPIMCAHGKQYTHMVHLPIDEPALLELPWYVPRALSMGEYYKVLPRLESVDGQLCHVVTSDLDTLWIDHNCGFAVRRRVEFIRHRNDDPGELGYLLTCGDFVEVADGAWLPGKAQLVNYSLRASAPNQHGRPSQRKTIRVTDIAANELPLGIFALEFPPGTLVNDLVKQKSYYMPEGVDLLDEAIAAGVDIVNGKVSGEPGFVYESDWRGLVPMLVNLTLVLVWHSFL